MSDFRLAGVMGWPVAHSRSPLLHGHWLQRHEIAGAYVPLAVRPDRLEAALRGLPALGFAGCNITVPHKEAALPFLDEADDLVLRTGSVNTILVRDDGSLSGRTTDGWGFKENLRHANPHWHARGGTATILGAGGSARAIAVALMDQGVSRIVIVNRTFERAQDLVRMIGGPLEAMSWQYLPDLLAETMLLVNTTTQGMQGQPPLAIDLRVMRSDATVADIVYVPLETPLLAQARSLGLTAVDGLGMLLYQAQPGFAAWFGLTPAVDTELRDLVVRSLG